MNMKKKKCASCEALMINGVYCHELGCPDAWKDEVRECKWCGRAFKPKEKPQHCCTKQCERAYSS